ncbi:vWA domain-containing protein [Oligosphaera ethanolica]|uniref:Uncharacterized protein YegL n=1 Tax=Oligosphaera ethanolica TaxID=760260 RepID=A0AAE4APZ8_9BACT|nr:vWA domain-containing protein [Oligosphaera ethanolica]MDQ0290548.1 uncharacterized protein YegL [Oligosphaera ethanolica]
MKHLSRICLFVLISFAGVFATTALAQNHVPMITALVLDASGSISDSDFNVQKAAAIKFMLASHELSKVYGGERSDWVAVSFFGTDDLYAGIPFVNVNRQNDLAEGIRAVAGYPHPKSGTAIYTAILKATVEVEQQYGSLPGFYMRNIILVTDGQDNSSRRDAKQLVEQAFPNSEFNLIVVGVGKDAKIDQFKNIADMTMMIDDYDELVAALLAARHALSN